MKKDLKVMSVALAVLMLVLAMPLSVFAETSKTVEFLYNGEVLRQERLMPHQVISKFPEVTPKQNGNIIRWFYKDTNIVVDVPYEVVNNAVIEAREIDQNSTMVAGTQCTTPAKNKQSVRFISTLHTLQASKTGFVVEAKYKQTGSNTIQTKNWDVSSTRVYTSILSTENGKAQSVSAAELGGTYLIVLSIDNVPTNIGQIDFYVTSYITVDGENITSGEATVFSMKNGVYNSTLSPLS